jgi:predicted  nucleic acid-binding Zn-ribbon protein
MKTLQVKCPGCSSILVVDAKTGKVVEHRKPLLDESESTGDRFADARKRVETASERIERQVEEAKQAQKDKLSKLESLFQERKKEIEESGEPIEKPESPFGRD